MIRLKQFSQQIILALAMFSIVACGSAGGGNGTTGTTTSVSNNTATSQLCANVTGLEAVYWDFSNGVPRGDLPSTAFTIPSDFTVNFAHPTILSFFFWHPATWTIEDVIADNLGSYGANLVRNDNQAVWRHVTTNVSNTSAATLLQSEVNTMLDFIGNPDATAVCEFNGSEPNFAGGVTDVSSALIRAGDFTANVNVRVVSVPLGGGSSLSQAAIYLVLAPTTEYAQLVQDVFVPIITQFYLGGTTEDTACSDNEDNDNDGKTDYPNDPECSSASDDSESVL